MSTDTAPPPEFVEAFTAAVVTTFGELTQTGVAPGPAYLTRPGPPNDWATATIVLGRAGGGRMTLALPRAVLETLAARYLADGVPLTPELADDAAGEFANVIAGQAKTMLRGTPHHFTLSTPTVGTARDQHGDADPVLAIPFTTDVGELALYVSPAV